MTITDGQPVCILSASLTTFSGRAMSVPLYTIFIAAVLLSLCWHNLKPTRVGRKMFAIGGSENCAKLPGINLNAFKRFVYTVGDLCAGAASEIAVSGLDSALFTLAEGRERSAISAIVIGGAS